MLDCGYVVVCCLDGIVICDVVDASGCLCIWVVCGEFEVVI